jgi:O-antigen/teichoic acid export membrane protein
MKFQAASLRTHTSRLAAPGFARSVAVLAGGSALAQAIPVALTPLLTRLYSPSDMGMLGLYTSFISFVSSSMTLGYSQAIVSGRDDQEGAHLTALSAMLVVPMSVVASVGLVILTKYDLLGYGELPLWAVVAMVLSLVLTGLYFTLRYWMVRVGNYRTISSATVVQSIGRMATQVSAGAVGLGWPGLVTGEVIGRISGLSRMWRESRSSLLVYWRKLDRRQLLAIARKYKKFPLLTTPSSLVNSLALVIPIPLITVFFGLGSAGQYAIATRIMVLPLSLVGASIADVFHNRIAVAAREHPDRALALFLRTVALLATLGLVPMIVVAVWGSELFSLVLGSDWALSGAIAASITPWILMQFVVNPVSRVVQVYQGQELKLVYDILGLASVTGVLVMSDQRDWTLLHTCAVLGWSQAGVYAVYLLLLVGVILRESKDHRSPESA